MQQQALKPYEAGVKALLSRVIKDLDTVAGAVAAVTGAVAAVTGAVAAVTAEVAAGSGACAPLPC